MLQAQYNFQYHVLSSFVQHGTLNMPPKVISGAVALFLPSLADKSTINHRKGLCEKRLPEHVVQMRAFYRPSLKRALPVIGEKGTRKVAVSQVDPCPALLSKRRRQRCYETDQEALKRVLKVRYSVLSRVVLSRERDQIVESALDALRAVCLGNGCGVGQKDVLRGDPICRSSSPYGKLDSLGSSPGGIRCLLLRMELGVFEMTCKMELNQAST